MPDHQIAIVTGAGRGIGKAASLALGKRVIGGIDTGQTFKTNIEILCLYFKSKFKLPGVIGQVFI